MKFTIKVSKYSLLHCCLIIILGTIPVAASAQNQNQVVKIIDTGSPQDPLIEPNIVLTPPTIIQPDCHTYTGCGLIVANPHYYYKPKHHKLKKHHIYREPYCTYDDCYMSPVMPGQCW